MSKKKNYDGWCAKTREGKWLPYTFSDVKFGARRLLIYHCDSETRTRWGANIVKVKLVEVK